MESIKIKKAFIIVWFIIDFTIFVVLLIPFVLPSNTILSNMPACEWKIKYHKECPVCGMTTAFILLSKGQINEAQTHNKGCLFLYALFIVNELIAIYCILFILVPKFTNKRCIVQSSIYKS